MLDWQARTCSRAGAWQPTSMAVRMSARASSAHSYTCCPAQQHSAPVPPQATLRSMPQACRTAVAGKPCSVCCACPLPCCQTPGLPRMSSSRMALPGCSCLCQACRHRVFLMLRTKAGALLHAIVSPPLKLLQEFCAGVHLPAPVQWQHGTSAPLCYLKARALAHSTMSDAG